MSTTHLGASDPRLADPEWLARHYAEHGDMWIALETGAARDTVRARREQFGIPSRPPGRRRGVTTRSIVVTASGSLSRTEAAVLDRKRRDSRPHGPAASWSQAIEHLAAADRARRDHNRTRERNAAVALAATAARIAEQLEST